MSSPRLAAAVFVLMVGRWCLIANSAVWGAAPIVTGNDWTRTAPGRALLAGKAGDVAAGMREAAHQTFLHGMTGPNEDDRDRMRLRKGSPRCFRADRNDCVDIQSDQLGSELRQAVVPTFCRPNHIRQILSLRISMLVEALLERVQIGIVG